MYQVKTNTHKNRLYVTLSGYMNATETKAAADAVVAAVRILKPGFGVINDISQFRPVSPEAAQEIERAQRFSREAGMGRVIRITGDNALTSMQFGRVSKAAGYQMDTARSVAEAERLLDN
jgi:hypothetical protein